MEDEVDSERRAGREGLSRRQILGGLGLGLGAAALPGLSSLGCGLGPRACGAGPDALPSPAARDASGRALLSNIDSFVFLMLENRSFDHLLGGLRLDRNYAGAAVIEGLTGAESNADVDGALVPVSRMPGDGRGSVIPKHDWDSVRQTFNRGRNDRFVAMNPGQNRGEVMGYLGRDQVPLFHALADRFTVFDRWFSSFMGPTWPNRYYLHAATSGGRSENKPLGLDAPVGIWERMAERCYSTRNYFAGPVLWYAAAFPTRVASGETAMVPGTIEDFFRDARQGNLPNLSVIDPDFKVNDAYPTHSPALCEAFVASIVRAMAESPQWSRSLLVITFDEHGGYYDHVAPPTTADARPDFRQLGFRVPALAIGPTVRQGGVVGTPLEHVSLAATLRARFGIASLGARMDAASDFSGCIDPALIGAPAPPPLDLHTVEIARADIVSVTGDLSSQSEMDEILRSGRVPSAFVDPRSDDERFRGWLRAAQELEALRVHG